MPYGMGMLEAFLLGNQLHRGHHGIDCHCRVLEPCCAPAIARFPPHAMANAIGSSFQPIFRQLGNAVNIATLSEGFQFELAPFREWNVPKRGATMHSVIYLVGLVVVVLFVLSLLGLH